MRDGVGDGVRFGVGGREFRRDDFRGLGLGFWTRDSRRRISAVRWDCVVWREEMLVSIVRVEDWIESGGVVRETVCGLWNAVW